MKWLMAVGASYLLQKLTFGCGCTGKKSLPQVRQNSVGRRKPTKNPTEHFQPEELIHVRFNVPITAPVIGPKTLVFWGVHQQGDEFQIHRSDYEALDQFLELVEPVSAYE